MMTASSHQCIILVGLAVLITTLVPGILGVTRYESCPVGWISYDKSVPNTCLYVSDSTTSSLEKAHEECVKKNASLIVIRTDEKLKFFKEIVERVLNPDTQIWIGMKKFYDEVKWMTKDGYLPATSNGLQFCNWRNRHYDYNYDYYNKLGLIYSDGTVSRLSSSSHNARYLCEKRKTCSKGWFGEACEKECNCYGQKCEQSALNITCSYGCNVGWMGPDCSQRKEDAEVGYFCVNSPDRGKYVHVRIDTKGVHYESINAIDEDGDSVSWCNNTNIAEAKDPQNTVAIKIFIDNSTSEAMKAGNCSGKHIDDDKYEWRVKIQEKHGLVSRNDQEVYIECDFADADSFELTGSTEIKRERWFRRSNIKKPIQYLKEKKEKVELKVVDPSTGKELAETQIGSPVVLRIDFGFQEGNVATGVRPYNCDATSADGLHSSRFLNDKSCLMEGFPISEFFKNGTKSIITKPFPLFGFDESEKVEFHCSYTLCFADEDCPLGCENTIESDYHNGTRFRRSVGFKPHNLMATVGLAADN